MNANEIKAKVSMQQLYRRLSGRDCPPNKKIPCLSPHNHNNGDSHPSSSIHVNCYTCHSQGCFKGDDIFSVIGKVENIEDFNDQKARIEELFTLNGQERTIVDTYDYTDETGSLLFQTVRYKPKDFLQRRPNVNGGWHWNLNGIIPVLYRLPDVMACQTVLVVEGEKDVETAYTLGLPEGLAPTCNPMGAGKWHESYSESLEGKVVVICPDRDERGIEHGKLIAQSLTGLAKELRWLDLPFGKDLTEWVEQGGTVQEFQGRKRGRESFMDMWEWFS